MSGELGSVDDDDGDDDDGIDDDGDDDIDEVPASALALASHDF